MKRSTPAGRAEGWAQYGALLVIDPERTFPVRHGYHPDQLRNWIDAMGMVIWIGDQARFTIDVVHGPCPDGLRPTPFRCVSGTVHVGSVEYILSSDPYDEHGKVCEGASLRLPPGDYLAAVEDLGHQRFRVTFEPHDPGPPTVWDRAVELGFTVLREEGEVRGFVDPYGDRIDLRRPTEPPVWLAPEWPVRKQYGYVVLLERDGESLALRLFESQATLAILGPSIEDVVADMVDQQTERVPCGMGPRGWGWEHPRLPAQLQTAGLPPGLCGTTLHITREHSWFQGHPRRMPARRESAATRPTAARTTRSSWPIGRAPTRSPPRRGAATRGGSSS